MPLEEVKQELEEPEDDGDPVEVPPGTVLHNLEDLLSRGRVLLRYRRPSGDAGWGVNGKVETQWCSFRAEPDGVCHFADGQPWCTEAAEEWAEDELEWLRRLQGLAEKCPATASPQPSSSQPRACRRAVFAFHKAEYRKKMQGEAPASDVVVAKSAPSKGVSTDGDAGPQRPKVIAKAPSTAIVKAKATGVIVKAKAPVAKEASPKAAIPSASAASVPQNSARGLRGTFREFLLKVKSVYGQTEPSAEYRQILKRLRKDEDDEVTNLLADHRNLLELFKKHASATAARRKKADTRISTAAEEAVPVDPEEVLVPLRELTSDAATRLVRLALGGRGTLPSQRLAMLRYLRTRPGCEEAYKQMFILRGPPGIGKTAYAQGQLSSEVSMPPAAGDRRAAQLCHVCSTDDFFTLRLGAATEEYAPEPDGLELAYARNQARVRLATEVGVHPIYVDDSHLHLWEMQPYVSLAKEAGYEVSIVEPSCIWGSWDSAEQLFKRNCSRAHPSNRLSQEQLRRLAAALEPLPAGGDPEDRVRLVEAAERPKAGAGARRAVAAVWAVLSAPGELKPDGAAKGEKRPAPAALGGGEPEPKAAKAEQEAAAAP